MFLNLSYWDSEIDGLDILNHTELSYLSRKSNIYNSSIGDVQVHAKPSKPIKYIYYGYSKEEMVKIKVRENSFGSYYVDSGNCMVQVYFGSTQIMENGIKTRDYFNDLFRKKNNEDYNNGAKTEGKWYLIISCEEIEDINNISFRGV